MYEHKYISQNKYKTHKGELKENYLHRNYKYMPETGTSVSTSVDWRQVIKSHARVEKETCFRGSNHLKTNSWCLQYNEGI